MIQRRFSHEDQIAFARLSGDWNPIHVDPVVARRLLYGAQVVHGLHLVSWVLDQLYQTQGNPGELGALRQLSAVFRQPVLVGQQVALEIAMQGDGAVQVELTVDQQVRSEISLRFEAGAAQADVHYVDGGLPQAHPKDRTFAEMQIASGALELRHDAAVLAAQFPNLAKHLDGGVASVLLASTRLVGMDVPGLHSLYSELELQFDGTGGSAGMLGYEVTQSHADFNLLNMALSGQGWQGMIRSFMRPAPTAQIDMARAAQIVGSTSLAGQHALIIGGSRGLGEACAKLLAAAGANVTMTYASGRADAETICEQIVAAGGRAQARHLDITELNAPAFEERFTHLYYFAAPRIKPGAARGLNPELLDGFMTYFATGFSRVVERAQGPIKVIYPSTVYVDAPEKTFAEYAMAKAAGEALCAYVAHGRADVEVEVLKLPRMKTDQTQAIMAGPEADEPADVLWPLIRGG